MVTTRSQQETAALQCPTCGKPFEAPVWLIIDHQERPDLVKILLDGDLNVARCPHCGAEGGITHPLLFHDAERHQVLVAMPLTVQGMDAAQELIGSLLEQFLDSIPPAERQPYMGEVELVPELDGLRAFLIEQTIADDDRVTDQLTAIAVQDLLNIGDELDFQRVIAEHRTLLLTPRAEEALDQIFRTARRSKDRDTQRRAQEAKAVLGRLRSIVINRRSALNDLLDSLAPLTDDEIAVLPQVRQMLDAIDPQEVYQARIALRPEQRDVADHLIERLAERAGQEHQTDVLTFLRNLALLPQQ